MQRQYRVKETFALAIPMGWSVASVLVMVELGPSLRHAWPLVGPAGLIGLAIGFVGGVAIVASESLRTRFAIALPRSTRAATLGWLTTFTALVFVLKPLFHYLLTLQTRFVPTLALPVSIVVAWGVVVVGQGLVRKRWPTRGLSFGWAWAGLFLGLGSTAVTIVGPYSPNFLPLVTLATFGAGVLAAYFLPRPTAVDRVVRLATFPILGGSIIVSQFVDTTQPAQALAVAEGVFSSGALRATRAMFDVDGDGFVAFGGGSDCDPWERAIFPGGLEVPGNGVDENCSGQDATEPTSLMRASLSPPVAKHLFLVSIDTLRADILGSTHVGEAVTPFLSTFMEDATRYTRAYSPSSFTNDSVTSIMSAELPQRWHKDITYFGQEDTLAQSLKRRGAFPFAVLALPWLHDGAILGFDVVDNTFGRPAETGTEAGDRVLQRFLQTLDAAPREVPKFGWIHILEPHAPYVGVSTLSHWGNSDRDRYLQDVRRADEVFGAFLHALRARGLYDDSIIVVVADHGEALGEHGRGTHVWGAWESIVRVPLIVRVPGTRGVVDAPVSTLDIVPTMRALLGAAQVEPIDGVVLPPWGAQREGVDVAVDERSFGPAFRARIEGRYKLIWDVMNDAWLLFDVVADPRELEPLDDPKRMTEMRKRLLGTWDATFNTSLLNRKAEMWPTRELFLPPVWAGDVGNTIELRPRDPR